MIDQRKLKELIKLMEDNNLLELDLQDDKQRVAIKRGGAALPVTQVNQAPQPPATNGVAPASATPAAPAADDDLLAVTSPMVGTFYAASSPEAEPLAKIGAQVDDETVVCIIEAMKVFNEIKAQVKGTIEKVLVENGQAIEFGQKLFLVKKG